MASSKHYDFDAPVDRKGTNCVKYDMAASRGKDPDLLPMWVADMDFRIPDEAIEALEERVRHGVFGYTDPDEHYRQTVVDWIETHQGWQPNTNSLVVTAGVICALAAAINAFTNPGDAVLIQPPVYYPFESMIKKNGRMVAEAPLSYDPAAEVPYSIDREAFEHAISSPSVKLFMLCNPHNPVGRVWSAEELRFMGEACRKHGVVVVSDEIHADFTRPGFTHTSFASLGDDFASNCVICTAASKTFNLAGMQTSNIFILSEELRERFKNAVEATGYDNINVMGLIASQACYQHGNDWLEQLKEYLEGNLAFMNDFISREIPELSVVQPQSTYLIWVDCSGLGLTHDELQNLVEKRAKLWLDDGGMFGESGVGFIRFNIATQRSVIEEALMRLRDAVRSLRARNS